MQPSLKRSRKLVRVIGLFGLLNLLALVTSSGTDQAAPASQTPAGRVEVDLSGPGWHLWQDASAGWQSEELFAPPVDLSKLPVHPPTGGWEQLNSSKAMPVSVPGTAEEYLCKGIGPEDDITGVTWWFRTIRMPEKPGARLLLRFEAARQRAEVYLDRQLVGYDLVGNTPFEADLTGFAQPGQQCQLAVRITDPGGNFAWQDGAAIKWGSYLIPISHGFGGITGRVRLIACDPVYIDDLYVQNTPAIREINIVAAVRNSTGAEMKRDLSVRILDPTNPQAEIARQQMDGVKLSPGQTEVTLKVTAPEAKLWDLDHPNLYRCVVELKQNTDAQTDAEERRIGFRWFAPEGIGEDAVFRLNGERIMVRTAISWGFFPINGIYPTPEIAQRQVSTAKALGLNMLTFHRCIGSPVILEQADDLGLLYYEEPGGYRSAETDEFAHALMREKVLRMVKRDRSHPSLAIFSLINERNPRQPFLPIERDDLTAAHALDPSRTLTLSSSWATNSSGPEVAKTHLRPFDQQIYSEGWWDSHRAGGPEVWREQFTPTTHLGYTENKREIVFRGEEGAVSTPPRLELIKADLKNSPRLGWDGAVYLEWYDTFKNFIQRKHLSDVFASVDSLTTALGAVSFYNQGRRIEDHRICNLNDGYAVNGWEAEILENHSGIVDCFRHPKADPRILAYYNQPLYVAVKIRNQILESPGTVTADFYLVNEKNLQGPHTLKIRVASPGVGGSDNAKTGGVSPLTPTLSPLATFRRQIAVNVAGGETFGQPLAEGIQIPVANASGQFRVEAVLLDSAGHQQARGHDEFLAVDWRQAKIADNGAVYEWGNVVSEFLKKEKRCQVPAFDDHQTKLDWILVARAPYEQPQVISAENFVDAAARPAPLSTTFVADRDFSSPLHQRQDKMVDFRWPAGSTPDPAVGADSDYGVRFEGWVLPPRSGRYTFATRSTGAVRLWVDDRHLIDAWADRSRPENHGVIELQQGKPAKVRLDFFHHRAIAQIQLLWSPPASQTLDPERFFERVRRDGTTLILADYADAWMPLLQKHTTLRYSGTFDLGTAWLGGQYFVRDHPLFKDLPVNQAMNWQYQKLVQTGRNRYGLKVEGEDFVAGCYQSTPFQLGTAVGTVRCGEGRVIFSTLAVCSNLAAKDQPSAVARKLLCNYLEFAARAPR